MNQVAQLQERYGRSQPYIDRALKTLILKVESRFGHLFYRRLPPTTKGEPRLLNLGCGDVKYDGWVNADFYNFHDAIANRQFIPDWMLDLTKPIRCPDGYWEGIFCEHTLEHLSYAESVFALSEMHRILQAGAWVRIVVPDLAKYVAFYKGDAPHPRFKEFRSGAEALSNLTQCWGHRSAWDGHLLCTIMREVGFDDVAEVTYGSGSDPRIIKDSEPRAWESVYVEGRRPPESL